MSSLHLIHYNYLYDMYDRIVQTYARIKRIAEDQDTWGINCLPTFKLRTAPTDNGDYKNEHAIKFGSTISIYFS